MYYVIKLDSKFIYLAPPWNGEPMGWGHDIFLGYEFPNFAYDSFDGAKKKRDHWGGGFKVISSEELCVFKIMSS